MKITKLTKPGELRSWLIDTAKEGEQFVALDLETTGLTKRDSIISGAVTGPGEHVAFFGPELIGELLDAPTHITYVLHNAPFDLRFLAWTGVALHTKFNYVDTLILAHLLDENKDHSLGALVLEHFNDNYKEEFWTKYKKAEDAPESELVAYNARDVRYTRELHDLLCDSLQADGIPASLISHVHSLQKSLLDTEISGIAVDTEYLMQKGVELKTRIAEILPKMRSLVADEISLIETELWLKKIESYKSDKGKAKAQKPEFNWDSPTQLLNLFYDKLKLPVQMSTPKKKKDGTYSKRQPTVDDNALKELKDIRPIATELRHYRAFQKAYGTYVEGILEQLQNGRIYPEFNVSGTKTGRISHSNPNMGNLPSRKKAKELDEPFLAGVRGMFVPDPGHVLISADFSQLEICISAHFTQDFNLLRIVNEGISQHDITAEGLGIERSLAKPINFGMQYGCTHKKVAKLLRVLEDEGKRVYDKYWKTYAGQKRVMDECAAKVDRGEPIISPFGRRRRFETRKRQSWDGAYWQAWNALVQGTGSDCTSRAFYFADRRLREQGFGRALFTVHDEIIIQVKKEHAEEAEKILLETMKNVGKEIGLTVQLKAEGSGPMLRWED